MKQTTAKLGTSDSQFFYELQKRDRYAAELFGDMDNEFVVFDKYYNEWQIVDRQGRVLYATDNVYDIVDIYVEMANDEMANDENVIY